MEKYSCFPWNVHTSVFAIFRSFNSELDILRWAHGPLGPPVIRNNTTCKGKEEELHITFVNAVDLANKINWWKFFGQSVLNILI